MSCPGGLRLGGVLIGRADHLSGVGVRGGREEHEEAAVGQELGEIRRGLLVGRAILLQDPKLDDAGRLDGRVLRRVGVAHEIPHSLGLPCCMEGLILYNHINDNMSMLALT